MKVLILCAGLLLPRGRTLFKERNLIKALWNVGGERLIDRQIRLLRNEGITDITIIYSERTKNIVNQVKGVKFFKIEKGKNRYDDMFRTRQLFEKGTMILLGDIFFTREKLQEILSIPVRDILWIYVLRKKPNYPTKYQVIGGWEFICLTMNKIGAKWLCNSKGILNPHSLSKHFSSKEPQIYRPSNGIIDIDYPYDVTTVKRWMKMEVKYRERN